MPAAAYAHDWYIINVSVGQCESASAFADSLGLPFLSTPAGAQAAMQSQGDTVFAQETKAPDGTLLGVTLSDTPANGGATSYYNFFTSAALCDGVLSLAEAHGDIVPPGDMQ